MYVYFIIQIYFILLSSLLDQNLPDNLSSYVKYDAQFCSLVTKEVRRDSLYILMINRVNRSDVILTGCMNLIW